MKINYSIKMFTKNLVCEVNRLRGGSLLVKCTDSSYGKTLYWMNKMVNIEVKVTPHFTLNFTRGVVPSYDLQYMSEEDDFDELTGKKMTDKAANKATRMVRASTCMPY